MFLFKSYYSNLKKIKFFMLNLPRGHMQSFRRWYYTDKKIITPFVLVTSPKIVKTSRWTSIIYFDLKHNSSAQNQKSSLCVLWVRITKVNAAQSLQLGACHVFVCTLVKIHHHLKNLLITYLANILSVVTLRVQ